MNDTGISVSDIRQWIICPRQLYFKKSAAKKGQKTTVDDNTPAFFESAIYRELLFAAPSIVLQSLNKDMQDKQDTKETSRRKIDAEKLTKRLKRAADEIAADLQSTGPSLETDQFDPDRSTEKEETLASNLLQTAERYGSELFECVADPVSEEKLYGFPPLDLYGAPPKVLRTGKKMMPYMIRTSKAPLNGVWESDRTAGAAYVMILEQEYGPENTSDFVVADYFGDYRRFRIRSVDRRKVFRTVRRIKEAEGGKMPPEKNIRLCGQCRYREACRPKLKSIFSKLLE